MALSFRSVEKAYEVFHKIKEKHIWQLNISSFPNDMASFPDSFFNDPWRNTVLGFDKKSDGGWENLCFWTDNPSEELKKDFDEWAKVIGNTSVNRYDENAKCWKFGWF